MGTRPAAVSTAPSDRSRDSSAPSVCPSPVLPAIAKPCTTPLTDRDFDVKLSLAGVGSCCRRNYASEFGRGDLPTEIQSRRGKSTIHFSRCRRPRQPLWLEASSDHAGRVRSARHASLGGNRAATAEDSGERRVRLLGAWQGAFRRRTRSTAAHGSVEKAYAALRRLERRPAQSGLRARVVMVFVWGCHRRSVA